MKFMRRHLISIHVFLLVVMSMQRFVRGFLPRAARSVGRTSSPRPAAALQRLARNTEIHHLLQHRQEKPSLLLQLDATTKRTASTAASQQDGPFSLVIVESPSKCKTISNILEHYVKKNDLNYNYIVESCMGHVRNLPKSAADANKKTAVVGVDIDHEYQPTYVLLPGKEALVANLKRLANKADKVILATDEDREGEAVAWHLTQVLGLHDDNMYERVTFTEITPTAIEYSIQHPTTLNTNLIQAQETRRILDRLAGYTLSPILWKKIAPGLSAGRVQSVGMALIVQRERERLLFVPVQYWDMIAEFGENMNATLTTVNEVPVATGSDFNNQGELISSQKRHFSQEDIEELKNTLMEKDDTTTWTVVSITSRQRKQSPPMPFTTSTLQQEANKRLGMSVSQTMQCAQSLYESGFISYMRTDSTTLSHDAQRATANMVSQDYGKDLVAPPRKGKQSKNAQEAHEAIRPAIQSNGGFLRPNQLTGSSKDVTLKLYELIYQRTVASRMIQQVANQTSVSIEGVNGDTTALFRVTGSVVLEPGYTLALGRLSSDTVLPPLKEGQVLDCSELFCMSHSTQPPPRYTEASFVKELEARGVGRPSTYAGTVKILRDRAYVGTPLKADEGGRPKSKARTGSAISAQRAAGGEDFTGGGRGPLVPSLSAFVVCSLLEKHCGTYVDPGFTAGMEERLDQIARGEDGAERVAYLDEFYAGDDGLAAKVKHIDETVSADEARRASLPSLFLNNTDDDNEIGLFIGPWGPYAQKIVTQNDTESTEKPPTVKVPAGMASDLSTITPQTLRTLLSSRERNGELMGQHPDDGRAIRLKLGPYGAYLQWGDDGEEDTTTHSLPKHMGSVRPSADPEGEDSHESLSSMIGLSLDEAVGYVSLPRTVCTMNELPIIAAIGPYGPYLKYNNSFVSLYKRDGDVLTVDAETAERVVTDGIINKKSTAGKGVIAELGEKDGSMVRVKDGRFGIYLNWKKVNAKLPAEYADNPETIPLDEAWSLIVEKGGGGGKASPEVELPKAPKRPKSAYLHFCAEKRPEVAENVKSLGEVSKELARLWAETTDRQRYEDLAAAGKVEYEEKKRDWQKECQLLLDKASSTKKRNGKKKVATSRVNGVAAPKRPKSSYLFFCADKRPEVSEKVQSLGDISKELARLWAETAENKEERQKYQDLADKDKKRYEQEMMEFRNGQVNGKEAPNKKKSSPKKQTTAKKQPRASSKKKKTSTRAPSAYMLFCGEHRKSIVDEKGEKLPFGETTKRLAQMWKECDEETRTRFQNQAAEEKEKLLQST